MVIDEELYKYFMNLETEKQKDVATIQRLLDRVSSLEKKLKEAKR